MEGYFLFPGEWALDRWVILPTPGPVTFVGIDSRGSGFEP